MKYEVLKTGLYAEVAMLPSHEDGCFVRKSKWDADYYPVPQVALSGFSRMDSLRITRAAKRSDAPRIRGILDKYVTRTDERPELLTFVGCLAFETDSRGSGYGYTGVGDAVLEMPMEADAPADALPFPELPSYDGHQHVD